MAFSYGNTMNKSTGFGSTFTTPSTVSTTTTSFGNFGSSFGSNNAFGTTANTQTSSNFGGTPVPSFGSTFGNTSTPGTGFFGTSTVSKPTLFGTPSASNNTLFTSTTGVSNFLGTPNTTTQTNLFGSNTNSTSSIFGSTPSTGPGLFGNTTLNQTNTLGSGTSGTTGSFGGLFGTSSLNAPNFGNFGLSSTGAFGVNQSQNNLFGNKPTAAITSVQRNQQIATSVFAINVFNDERDDILKKWNMLQASWGTGKGYYHTSQMPIEYTPQNQFYLFKAMGYNIIPEQDNSDGLVKLTFEKNISELRYRDLYIRNKLSQVIAQELFIYPDKLLYYNNSLLPGNLTKKLVNNQNRESGGAFFMLTSLEVKFVKAKSLSLENNNLSKKIKSSSVIRNQSEVLRNGLLGILGNKPNLVVEISLIRAISDSQTEVRITVSEKDMTGTVRKILSSDLSAYLNQQPQKQQLSNVGVSQISSLITPTKSDLEEYLATPPLGIDLQMWQAAIADNPNQKKYIPVPINGFSDLRSRMLHQEYQTGLHQAFIDNVNADITNLKTKHASSIAQIVELKQKFMELQHRIIKILVRQESTRNVGLAILPEEELMRGRLEVMHNQLNIPKQFKGQINEILSHVKMIKGDFRTINTNYRIDADAQQEIKQFLIMEQNGIKQLVNVIHNDLKTIKTINEGYVRLAKQNKVNT